MFQLAKKQKYDNKLKKYVVKHNNLKFYGNKSLLVKSMK